MRWVNETINNYNIILWIPFLLFVFIFHNKAALLCLFQTAFSPPRCLLLLLFFLFTFSHKPKPSSGSWRRFSPGGCLCPSLEPVASRSAGLSPTRRGLCPREPGAEWQPRHADDGPLGWWSPGLPGKAWTSFPLAAPCPSGGAQRRASTRVRHSKILCSNGGDCFHLKY